MDRIPEAALLAIDWGTTVARAYRLDANGEVLARHSAELGIQRVANRAFPDALASLLGNWRTETAPWIACGMIGSRQGWIEAPYVACPADLATFGSALVRAPEGRLAIVPGATCRDDKGVPDVMRGEETQLIGAVTPDEERVLAVLPGTHSKWALVERGTLRAFATFMTGELFAVLLDHSILGRLVEDGGPEAAGAHATFLRGLERGLTADGLSHVIFGARTLALAGDLEPTEIRSWISGVLIGHEIAAARRWASALGADSARVRVIGDPAIVDTYVAALTYAAVTVERGCPDAAAHGLWRIALRAGLIARGSS